MHLFALFAFASSLLPRGIRRPSLTAISLAVVFLTMTLTGALTGGEVIAAPTVRLRGRVIDAVTRRGIEAVVVASPVSGRVKTGVAIQTGGMGHFELKLPPGQYVVTVTSGRHMSQSRTVVLKSGQGASLVFTLKPVPVSRGAASAVRTSTGSAASAPQASPAASGATTTATTVETKRVYSGTVSLARLDVAAGDTVEFDPNVTTTVTVTGNVVVKGTLVMRPAKPDVVHTLRFTGADEKKFVGGHTTKPLDTDVGLWIIEGGVWDAKGAAKTAWLRSATGLVAGAKVIVLESAPTGWQVNDELVVTPTQPPSVAKFYDAYDYPKVASISGNVVTLDRALTYAHPSVTAGGKLITPEVLNLTRNVRVEGLAGKRAHIIWNMATNAPTIKYVAARYLGPQQGGGKKGPERVLGRYGFHLHEMKDASRGALFEGVVGRDMGNWMFVPHASHGTTWRDVVGHNGYEDIFTWDRVQESADNASHDTVWEGVVGSRVLPATGLRNSAFELVGGLRNKIIDSVAVGVQGIAQSNGMEWPSGESSVEIGAGSGVWETTGNVSHNNQSDGWFVWQNTGNIHVVGKNSVIYHNGGTAINHGAYNNPYQYTTMVLFANGSGGIEIHANSKATPLPPITFTGMVIDAAGLSDYAVYDAKHVGTLNQPTRFTGPGCVFRGFEKAAIGVVASGGEPTAIEVTGCVFEGLEVWIETGANKGSIVRLLDLKLELRHKSQSGDYFAPKWNAMVKVLK